jgi:hypothetical protein
VLICLGGLFDGDLIVRAQMLLGGKTPYTGGGMISDVAPEHRLSIKNPTFRGNLMVSEGTQSGTAILNQSDGICCKICHFRWNSRNSSWSTTPPACQAVCQRYGHS